MRLERCRRPLQRSLVGRRGRRVGLTDQRAQVGVFPLLDAPVRQALPLKRLEGARADAGDRGAARQHRRCLAELIGQRPFNRVDLDHCVHR